MQTSPIHQIADRSELLEWYSQHREVHVYGLADLDDRYWDRSKWFRRGDAVVGVVSLPGPQDVTIVYAATTTDESATTRLLLDLSPQIPDGALVAAPQGAAKWMSELRAVEDHGSALKLHIPNVDQLIEARDVQPIASEHVHQLSALYERHHNEAFFLPSMLENGLWCCVVEGGRIIAAGGTHVLSESSSVVALGGILTDSAARGRGLGSQITSWLSRSLLSRGLTVGLNVQADNYSARSIYRRLGFIQGLEYEEFKCLHGPETL